MNECNILSADEIYALIGHYYEYDNGYVCIEKIKIDGVYIDAFGIRISKKGFSYNYHVDFGHWDYNTDNNNHDLPESKRHYKLSNNVTEVSADDVLTFTNNVFEQFKKDMKLI